MNKNIISDCSITLAQLANNNDCKEVITLINAYRTDPMGGCLPVLSKEGEIKLIEGLKNHPLSLIAIARINSEAVGLIICFEGFSTFKTKPLLNIHDIIVLKEYRGKGIGSQLLSYAAQEAKKRDCCRLTLEVRTDNFNAQQIYKRAGFTPCDNPMEFWVKKIT